MKSQLKIIGEVSFQIRNGDQQITPPNSPLYEDEGGRHFAVNPDNSSPVIHWELEDAHLEKSGVRLWLYKKEYIWGANPLL